MRIYQYTSSGKSAEPPKNAGPEANVQFLIGWSPLRKSELVWRHYGTQHKKQKYFVCNFFIFHFKNIDKHSTISIQSQ